MHRFLFWALAIGHLVGAIVVTLGTAYAWLWFLVLSVKALGVAVGSIVGVVSLIGIAWRFQLGTGNRSPCRRYCHHPRHGLCVALVPSAVGQGTGGCRGFDCGCRELDRHRLAISIGQGVAVRLVSAMGSQLLDPCCASGLSFLATPGQRRGALNEDVSPILTPDS